jgi:aspartyl-tRNA(Asn)/glutamyl-tRNA(Gln) amidotransferase subunit A
MKISTDTLFLSVRELGKLIKSKQLSPVELTEAYLERARTLGTRLNAYATLTPDLALRQARAAEAEIRAGKYRGPLHGIPYAAKDLLAVKGYPTQWGARPYANQKFDQDASVIKRLEQAGAVLLGKAAMIELAGGMGYRFASASISGAAKNPWNEGCWTCGSSSGSGAIVSAGLAAFAIGTETWGSIVCPSSFTGISGLRPTYGRVSRHGAMALAYSMDKIGPMARAAEDCGLILAAIAGHDDGDRASLPPEQARFMYPESRDKTPPLRIGWLEQRMLVAGGEQVMKDAVAVVKKSGANMTDAKLPDGPWEAAAGIVVSVEGAAAFDSLIESGKVAELVDPSGKIGGYVNQAIPSGDFLRTQRIRGVLQTKMAEMFANYDVLASATLPVTASKIEENLEEGLNFADPMGGIGNFLGLPAISVPCGFAENKMPLGLQFVAAPLNEHLVLRAATEFQSQTDWHKKRPPLAS